LQPRVALVPGRDLTVGGDRGHAEEKTTLGVAVKAG
jgi:hypothetical protein